VALAGRGWERACLLLPSSLGNASTGDPSNSLMPYKPPYAFSVTIGENCTRQMRTFQDLAEKLRMPVEDSMRQCNGKVSPSKALVKGLAKELKIDESFLNRLAEEVRKDLG
jgi:hypothetical protein